jgi:AcrR family transcriptional regulator
MARLIRLRSRMPPRKAWGGSPPANDTDARRRLIEVARACIEEYGYEQASLGDVAARAGVTRKTVYRLFPSSEDLFRSAATLASGGFVAQLRRVARRHDDWGEGVVAALVFTIADAPQDPHLGPLIAGVKDLGVAKILEFEFAREELSAFADGKPPLGEADLRDLTELLIRLIHSFLAEPGQRDRKALRQLFRRWLLPAIHHRCKTLERA